MKQIQEYANLKLKAMDINKLFGNKFIMDAAMSALKKAMKAGNIKACLIQYNTEKDEVMPTAFIDGLDYVAIPATDLEYFKKIVIEYASLLEKNINSTLIKNDVNH